MSTESAKCRMISTGSLSAPVSRGPDASVSARVQMARGTPKTSAVQGTSSGLTSWVVRVLNRSKMTASSTLVFGCLTTELSGRPRPPLRIGEHVLHCEHYAPTMIHGLLDLRSTPRADLGATDDHAACRDDLGEHAIGQGR